MPKTFRRLLLSAAAIFIIFFPCCGDRPFDPLRTVLRPIPPCPPALECGLLCDAFNRAAEYLRSVLTPIPPSPPAMPVMPVAGCGLPCDAFNRAVEYLRANWSAFSNRRYISVIDYSEPSTSRRFFLFDLETGDIKRYLVSHGKNSGLLYATRFSNKPESLESPLGFFRTGRKYHGSHGPSLELDGLQKGINDNTARRRIVLHGAPYAGWRAVLVNQANSLARLGRSLGCPALPLDAAESVIDKIKDGSLLFIYFKRES